MICKFILFIYKYILFETYNDFIKYASEVLTES